MLAARNMMIFSAGIVKLKLSTFDDKDQNIVSLIVKAEDFKN
jgi:hypothetical protein